MRKFRWMMMFFILIICASGFVYYRVVNMHNYRQLSDAQEL
ncbi:MAG: hypothetical protein JWN30_828 [Bacilli bacterium]|nr:hypothetical protein [Bacilli bacterium]